MLFLTLEHYQLPLPAASSECESKPAADPLDFWRAPLKNLFKFPSASKGIHSKFLPIPKGNSLFRGNPGRCPLSASLICFSFQGIPFQIPYNSKGTPLDFKGYPFLYPADFKGDPLGFQRNPLSKSLQFPYILKRAPLHFPAEAESNPLWFQRRPLQVSINFKSKSKGTLKGIWRIPLRIQRMSKGNLKNFLANLKGF